MNPNHYINKSSAHASLAIFSRRLSVSSRICLITVFSGIVSCYAQEAGEFVKNDINPSALLISAQTLLNEAWSGEQAPERAKEREKIISQLIVDASIPLANRFEFASSSANSVLASSAGLTRKQRLELLADAARKVHAKFPLFPAAPSAMRQITLDAQLCFENEPLPNGDHFIEIDICMPTTVVQGQSYVIDVAALSSAPGELYVFRNGAYHASDAGQTTDDGLAHIVSTVITENTGVEWYRVVAITGAKLITKTRGVVVIDAPISDSTITKPASTGAANSPDSESNVETSAPVPDAKHPLEILKETKSATKSSAGSSASPHGSVRLVVFTPTL